MFKFLERQVEILKKALVTTEAQLKRERDSHAEQVAKYERAMADAVAQGQRAGQRERRGLPGPSEEVRTMQKRVREVEAEATVTTNLMQAKVEATQTKVWELENQIQSLEESMAQSESTLEESRGGEASLKREAGGLRAQLGQLQKSLEDAQTAVEEEQEQQAALREKLKETLQGQIAATEQAKEAGQKAAALAQAKKALETEVAGLKTSRAAVAKGQSDLQSALQKAENDCAAARARESSYREELLQSSTRASELQRQLKQEEDAVPAEASRAIERLQGELKERDAQLSLLEGVQRELQEQSAANEGLRNTVKELKEAFAVTPDEYRKKIEGLEAELLESQESLQASLADQEAVFRSELAEAADRQAELLRRLEEEKEAVPSEAQDTIVRLRDDLDRSRADAEAHLAKMEASHRAELVATADRQAELLRRLEEAKEVVPNKAQDAIDRLQGELGQSRANAAEAEARQSELEKKLQEEKGTTPEAARNTITRLKEELDQSASRFGALEAALSDLRELHERETRELRTLNTGLEGSLADLEEQSSTSQSVEESLRAQMEDLQVELSDRSRVIEDLEARCYEAEDGLEEAKKELEKAEEQHATVLSSTDEALDSNVNTLRATLKQTSLLLEGSQTQNDELMRQVMQMNSKVASQEKALEEAPPGSLAEGSLLEARATIEYLKGELSALRAGNLGDRDAGRVGVVHMVFNAVDVYLSRTGQRLVDLFAPFDSDRDGKLEEWEAGDLLRTIMPRASEKDIQRCTAALCCGPGRALYYSELLQRLARSGNEGVPVSVNFNVDFLAGDDEEVRLIGSHAALGNWSVSQAPAMEVRGDERGTWSAEVALPAGGVYEYKYVLVTKDGQIAKMWQPGPNLVLALSPPSAYVDEGEPAASVHDAWEGCPLTAPFGSSVNARATVLGTMMARVTAAELASEQTLESAEAMQGLAAWLVALAGSGSGAAEEMATEVSGAPAPAAAEVEPPPAATLSDEVPSAPEPQVPPRGKPQGRRLRVDAVLGKLADLKQQDGVS
jgi:chromosome segregation ATPase